MVGWSFCEDNLPTNVGLKYIVKRNKATSANDITYLCKLLQATCRMRGLTKRLQVRDRSVSWTRDNLPYIYVPNEYELLHDMIMTLSLSNNKFCFTTKVKGEYDNDSRFNL